MVNQRSSGLLENWNSALRALACCLIAVSTSHASDRVYAYVGEVGPEHVLLAWGQANGSNTIGRSSKPIGKAVVKLEGGPETAVSDHNYAIIRGLTPDRDYKYRLEIDGKERANGQFRTWQDKSEAFCFFVMGDWGSGDRNQTAVAQALVAEFKRRADSGCPARFLITTGDNIYGRIGFTLSFRNSGDRDSDWERKFYEPYEEITKQIPFYPTLGNHDGNETESQADLGVYLDNFFFPLDKPARYYRFNYGGFADFFALDSTTNSENGPPKPAFLRGSDQHKWLEKNLAEAQVPWKIPYFHHPVYNAGPRHPAVGKELAHFLELFEKNNVRVVFNGHEHNFQYSFPEKNIRYVVSGAGGELRTANVRSSMPDARIEAWAPELHFCSVEVKGKEMTITPIGSSGQPVRAVKTDGKPATIPLKIAAP